MTTLISYHTSKGCEGRCDAKCYNAKHEKCDCICGGTNHGAGLEKAMENTRELAEEWIEMAKDKGTIQDAKINTFCNQLAMAF